MEKLLIKNGTVWNGNGFLKRDVLFEGKTVKRIEENIADDTTPRVFDAKDMLVLPGFIDVHMHMLNVTDDIFGISAEAGCLPNGVTCAAEASACKGDEAYLDTLLIKNVVFAGGVYKNNRFDFAGHEGLLKKYGRHAIGLKVFFDTTVSDIRDIAPLKETCAFARDRGLKVMVHSSNSPVPMIDIVKALNKGDILTHSFHGGKNNSSEDSFECLLYAKEKGVIVDTGFAGYVHTDFGVLRKAAEMNIFPDTISTDLTRSSAFIRSGRYGMNFCMSIMRTLGMPEEDILNAVTKNAAAALNKSGEWGVLDIGSTDATVLALKNAGYSVSNNSENTICDTKSYRTCLTVVNGDVVYRD